MPRICTAVSVCAGGNHASVTIDGRTYQIGGTGPLTDDELTVLDLLSVRQKGLALSQLLNRVVFGDEATNVKQYDIIGAGVAVTKTNIGTAYTNVLPGLNGQRALVDFTGCTQFRIVLSANLVGTGQFGARLIRDNDSAVLFEQANLGAAGERELDSDWQTIPGGFSGLTYLRLQAKSQTAADDPIFRGCKVGLR